MLAAVLIVVVLAAAYRYSIGRRPYRKCWRCGGSKRNISTTMWPGTFGRCHVCGGSGHRARWGVRILMPRTYEEIKSGRKGKNF